MINQSEKKTKKVKTPKVQEANGMRATRHEIHENILGFKHLKLVRDEEHNST